MEQLLKYDDTGKEDITSALGITNERSEEIADQMRIKWETLGKENGESFGIAEYLRLIVSIPQTPEEVFAVAFAAGRRLEMARTRSPLNELMERLSKR